jgi:hypothetical protein
MAADMAWVELNLLVISEDIPIVEALVGGDGLSLPLDVATLKGNASLLQEILKRIGLSNPAGAAMLLAYDIKGT